MAIPFLLEQFLVNVTENFFQKHMSWEVFYWAVPTYSEENSWYIQLNLLGKVFQTAQT